MHWIEIAKQIQSIAQAGLTFSKDSYDIERYKQLSDISCHILENISDLDFSTINPLFTNEDGYPTPKSDIRGVLVENGKILMVRESLDNCWALPGGWADIGLTPKEVIVKEFKEETGLDIIPIKLLAVMDKKCHPHPPSPYHVYKFFILCKRISGSLNAGFDILDVAFFSPDELPQLSEERNTVNQIKTVFDLATNLHSEVAFD